MIDIQKYVDAIVRSEARSRELQCWKFMKRTGLAPEEITLVHYKGKAFPQWRGAWKTS